MTNPDYRATPEQWDNIEGSAWGRNPLSNAACLLELRARVEALEAAQRPVSLPYKLPEPVVPTDEDLEDLAEVMNVSGNPVPAMRRALELWGNSQGILDSSPQPEPVAPTDEELLASVRRFYGDQVASVRRFYGDQAAADMEAEDDLRTARAVLARWGQP